MKYKLYLTLLLLSLIIILTSISSFAENNNISSSNDYDSIMQSLKNAMKPLDNNYVLEKYYIYENKTKNVILYMESGILKSYKDNRIKSFDSINYKAYGYSEIEHGDFYEESRRDDIIVSPDGNLVVFYDKNRSSFLYNIKTNTILSIPINYAQPIWNSKGNDISFVMSRVTWIYSVLAQSVYSLDVGLWLKQKGGSYKVILSKENSIEFIGYKKDGAHFLVGGTPVYYGIGMGDTLSDANDQEYVYTVSNQMKKVISIPEGVRIVEYKKISSFNNPDCGMYSFGDYIVTPYKNGYVRYNIIKRTTDILTIKGCIFGIYKNYLYYYDDEESHNAIILKKLNINTLKEELVTRLNTNKCTFIFDGSKLHYKLTKIDSKTASFYVLDMKTNKISGEKEYLGYFNIYTLAGGYKLCFGRSYDRDFGVKLYNPNNELIENMDSFLYYKNQIYTILDKTLYKENYKNGKYDYDKNLELEINGGSDILQYKGKIYVSSDQYKREKDEDIPALYICDVSGKNLKAIIADESPIAIINMAPKNNITDKTSIIFNSASSYDLDVADTIIATQWQIDSNPIQNTVPNGKFTVGSHIISLRVQDNHGVWSKKATRTFTVVSSNRRPVPFITMTPERGVTTSTQIVWDYRLLTDLDRNNKIVKCEWQGKQNNYSKEGEYTVTLRVQDNNGIWSDPVSKTFYVMNTKGIQQIVCGESYTAALMNDGTVKVWGKDYINQLGVGYKPTTVSGLSGVVQIASGNSHIVALLNDGTVKTWGFNYRGQLGDGTTKDRDTPVKVRGLSGVKQVSAGVCFTVALMNDGTVKAWGNNSDGELGNGTERDSCIPVTVKGLSEVKYISSGEYHSVALMEDGSVKSWGDWYSGSLGYYGYDAYELIPGIIKGLNGVKQIACVERQTIFLLNDGTVKTCGYNENGELGLGTTKNVYEPVMISKLMGVNRISTNMYNTLAFLDNGTVMAWGFNWNGELGDDSISKSITPKVIPELSEVHEMFAGVHFIIQLMNDGTVRSMGQNSDGELGDGTTINKDKFVTIEGLP